MRNKNKPYKFLGLLAPINSFFRILVPLFIFQLPFITTILAILLDWIDAPFFRQRGFSRERYDAFDKMLDLYWYTVSLVYALASLPFKSVLVFLYLIRLTGHLLFFKTRKELFFMVFPNFYEIFFVLLVLIKTFPTLSYLSEGHNLLIPLLILFPAQLVREIYLHKFDERFYPFLPEIFRGPSRMYTK